MKIALYVPSWPPGSAPNGIVTYASQLVPEFRRLGHEVFVLTPNRAAQDNDPRTIDLRRYSSAPTLWDRVLWKLAPESALFSASSSAIASAISDLVAAHGLDVFEIEESFGWSHAVSRLNLVPVVVRLHGPWFLNGRFDNPTDTSVASGRRQQRERRGIRQAQLVTAPSNNVLQAVRNHYALDTTATRVIPNPIEAVDDGATWNLDTTHPQRLLFVGRFNARKGGDLVLRAFGEIAQSHPGLTLTFVGPNDGIKGQDETTLLFEDFVRRKLPEQVRPRIEFRGPMNHAEVASLRRDHFATIVASRYEITPYSVLEAMSLGCPVIATAVGGIPEMIKDRHNGLLVPADDAEALAVAFRTLLEDHALAARLGQQAWLDCRTLYRPDIIAGQTIAAYRDAIDAVDRAGKVRE